MNRTFIVLVVVIIDLFAIYYYSRNLNQVQFKLPKIRPFKINIDISKFTIPITSINVHNNIFELESKVLSNIELKTDPVNPQLLYADYVQYVRNLTIPKTNFCSQNPYLTTILFVWTRVDSFDQRRAVRQTWAQSFYRTDSSIKLLFVLGSKQDQATQDKVFDEDREFDDLLQFDFSDSYTNCTLKSIGILRWTLFFCKSIKLIMKSDDDILINPENLEIYLQEHINEKKTIFGVKAFSWGVIRNKANKYYISRKNYSRSRYPDFIVGSHIMSSDCIPILYERCLKSLPAFILEDVYVTGILAENTNISLVNEEKFIKLDVIKKEITVSMFHEAISFSHDFGVQKLIQFWKTLAEAEIDNGTLVAH